MIHTSLGKIPLLFTKSQIQYGCISFLPYGIMNIPLRKLAFCYTKLYDSLVLVRLAIYKAAMIYPGRADGRSMAEIKDFYSAQAREIRWRIANLPFAKLT